ncbi:uncharacterized protein LOC129808430 [Phlebotomus papatasi]|uniref:uncharacterized protein LOC129808430 n=1 Tax=Phlebotomus papatasi TaxID=29031 RepID=UPI002483E44B|nr:uncharacterized protein LOC129808430 [Phlebotomus papatasi]
MGSLYSFFAEYANNKGVDSDQNLPSNPTTTLLNKAQSTPTGATAQNVGESSQPQPSILEIALARLIDHQQESDRRNQLYFQNLNETLLNISTNNANHTSSDNHQRSNNKLPPLTVPDFSGDYTAWKNFKDMFLSIIDKDSKLSQVQKLQYLKTYVKDEALKLISEISVTEENYVVAWDALVKHYDDTFTVVNCQIDRFCKILSVAAPTASAIAEVYTTASSVINSLDALKVTSRDPWVIYFLLAKLDQETRTLWSQDSAKKMPTCQDFMEFLDNRLRSLRLCQSMPSNPLNNPQKPSNSKPLFSHQPRSNMPKPNQASVLAAAAPHPCTACNQMDHKVFRCPTFHQMSPTDRLAFVRRKGLCRKCLVGTHASKDCTYFPCRRCSNPHNTLLHDSFYPDNTNTSSPNQALATATSPQVASIVQDTQTNDLTDSQDPLEPVPPVTRSNASAINSNPGISRIPNKVFLETAVVQVLDRNGIPMQCRALLDSGAQVNLISQSLYQRLKLPKTLSNIFIGSVVQGGAQSKYQTDCTVISLVSKSSFTMPCQIVTSVLEQKIPNWEAKESHLQIPSDFQLADPTWFVPQPIELLISNEFYNELISGKSIKLGPGMPVLKESCLGWIISGPFQEHPNSPIGPVVATTLASIDTTLKKFWASEEVEPPRQSNPDHLKVEEVFRNTTVRDSTGRYITHIPFKHNLGRLDTNLPNATKQFLSLERKLQKNPTLRENYDKAMSENFTLNFFEEVPDDELSRPCYYLPHHAVVKTTETSTKTRVVMNASSKSQTGLSLNDVAMMGPTVLPDIVDILLRFRMHEFAFTCDIEKMYPQILIYPPHRDYHRILWRFDPDQPIKHFRARGVCFGVTSSPFLATRGLNDLADHGKHTHPLASYLLTHNFYVDDCLVSVTSINEARQSIDQLQSLLASAGMKLAKWNSNEPSMFALTSPNLNFTQEEATASPSSTLGMIWRSTTDQFHYKLSSNFAAARTKREILACVASLYDPLGLIGPTVVCGKLILQTIWKNALVWDQPIPDDILREWLRYSRALPAIEQLTIPRWISTMSGSTVKELHIFTDASSYAYGAVAYAVSEDSHGHLQSQIVIAKSRVAPTEAPTIPRLELCAALLGARLLKKISNSIAVPDYFMWTDSTIVLGQIRSK